MTVRRLKPDWQSPDGRIQLHRANCLDILPLLLAGDIASLVTDPPFGIVNKFGFIYTTTGGRTRGVRCLEFAWDTPSVPGMVAKSLGLSLAAVQSAFVFCGLDNCDLWSAQARARGFTVKPAAFVKKYPPPAGKGNWWPSGFELAFYAYRPGAWFGDKDPRRSNVFVANTYRHGTPGKCGYPTQKPRGLVRAIVRSITPPGGCCLDPFLGSGTTAVACIAEHRRCVGIEISREGFAIAVRRCEEALVKLPLDGTDRPASIQGDGPPPRRPRTSVERRSRAANG